MNLDNKVTTFEGKKILIVDIETSGLLNVIKSKDDLHIMSVGWKTPRGEWKVKSTDDEKDIKKIFEDENNIIVGHNFIGYDIRALEKMFPDIEYKAQIIDTLPLSQYLFNDRPKHGLESWGVDVGFEKVEISSEEWVNLSKEKAIERCERDVLINALLWDKFYNLLMDLYDNDENQLLTPINRANFKQHLLVIQEENKIFLDVEQCQKNIEYLEGIISEKENVLKSVMPKIPIKTKKSKPKNMFKKDGGLSKAGEEWNFIIQSIGLPLEYEGEVEIIKGYKEPNPQSSTQMKDWLFSLGWKPKIFKGGANGKVPQLRDDNKNLCKTVMKLVESVPELEALQGLSVAQHRLGYLKAFMDTKDENNYITASWSGMAKTWRVKHKKPIVNLPSNNSEHGGLVRSCLIAPKGKVFCNNDISSLEDVLKLISINPYDPEYVKSLQDPNYDAHLNIGLLGGFMTQAQVDFYKWYNKTHGEGECPIEEFKDKKDSWSDEFIKLSKIRKSCKVTNYSCVPSDNTEVLTKNGWKCYKNIQIGEEVWSYNTKINKYEWCEILNKFYYKNAKVAKIYFKDFSIESTLNHRWLCINNVYKMTHELTTSDYILNNKGSYDKVEGLMYSRKTNVFCLETKNYNFCIKKDGVEMITGNCTYGASAKKISETADIPLKDGKKLHEAFWNLNWSVKKFAEDRAKKVVDGREWVYSDFSKIWYLLSSPHLVFSVVNQSSGACVFDTLLYFIIKEGITPIKTIHDELSYYINEGEEEETITKIQRAVAKTNAVLKSPIPFRSTTEFAKSYGDVH